MKRLLILLALAFTVIGAGCSDPLEQRSGQEVEGQLERGVSGQGKLVPHESTANPNGVPTTAETPPEYPPR